MTPTYIGDIDLNEETLAHYGVKGMKWGKRKARPKGKIFNKREYYFKKSSKYMPAVFRERAGANVDQDIALGRKIKNSHVSDPYSNVARTNEELNAMRTAHLNQHYKNVGSNELEALNINGNVISRKKKKRVDIKGRYTK